MPACHALACSHLEQPRGARVVGAVDGVAETRQRLALRAMLLSDLRSTCLHAFRCGEHLFDERTAAFHRAHEGAAHAQQTRRHGRLQRLGGGVVNQPRDDGAGREAMFHQRDQHCIEQRHLHARGSLTGELKQDHLGEAHLTDQIIDEVGASHMDGGFVRGADGGGGRVALAHDKVSGGSAIRARRSDGIPPALRRPSVCAPIRLAWGASPRAGSGSAVFQHVQRSARSD